MFGLLLFALGYGQWLVLRRRFRQAGWWILATGLGGWLGGMAAHAINPPGQVVTSWTLFGTVIPFAILMAAFQWVVLRRWVGRAGLWLAAQPAATLIGAIVGTNTARLILGIAPQLWEVPGAAASAVIVGMVGGLVSGLLSGLVLFRLPPASAAPFRAEELSAIY